MAALQYPEERKALATSLLFHGLIAAICLFGLPHLKTPPLEIMQPIPIDIMELGPVTTTTKVAASNIAKPPEPTPAPPTPITPPQQKQEPTPTPTPKPPAPTPVAQEPEPALANNKDADIPKPPPKKETPKEKLKPKPVEDSQQFSSLLKNLAVDKPQPAPVPAVTKTPPKAATPPAGSAGVVSDHLTISQEDALRRQIEQCWNISAGGRNIQDIIVELYIEMNPDRTVKTAKINSVNVNDSFGKAMADSALRAVLNPKCSPFNLPEDRYETWREITMRFNPKDMM